MLREENEDEAGKHDHVDLVISNGMILRYTDPRRFGARLWCEDLATSSVLAHGAGTAERSVQRRLPV